MEKMGRNDIQTRKELSDCVKDYLLPYEFRVSGWIEKEMRQPLLIKVKGKNRVTVNRKAYTLDELKPFLERYKEEYGDDYVYFGSFEKEEDESLNNILSIINSAGFNLVDPDDFQ